ncbi:MAG: Coenzyme F420 hydrogenase/dehydrogenase, beta subunit C-terminal domain [Bacillota bacterium]|nr:Coenzyme F420 hydrogenase/dehydrogenase, beta subunit C-terminal domain [Bacillota bacterium]
MNEAAKHDTAVYAGYVENSKELMECSSGGIATAISRHIIRNGGYVAGVAYSEDFYSVRYEIAHTEEELEKFKGSKYIDADKGTIYKDVKVLLDAGETVLFFGSPCIVAAMKAFLKDEYENLITCELVCEGPTTMEVHRQYIEHLEKKFDSKVVEFTVRRKKDAWVPKYMYAKFENGKVFLRNFRRTEYCYAFKVYAKPACYVCKFKGHNRKGDMTLGDFWGATPKDVFWNEKGVSSIFVHTEKAKKLLLETEGIRLFDSDFERATAENPMMIKSRKMRSERAKFEKLFKKHGLIYAARHSMKFKDRVSVWVKNHTPAFIEKLLKKLLGR